MRFSSPEWFLLLPVIALAAWHWRALRSPLRLLCLLLLALIATGPQLRRFHAGLDVWVLADRSASAAESVGPRLAEWERILERSKGRDDRLFIVDFATEAALRGLGESLGNPAATRTSLAAHYALSQMASDRPARLLALTDGFATDDLSALPERLQRQRVPLDYRLATDAAPDDFRIAAFTAPPQARPGEPFLLEFRIAGPNAPGPQNSLLPVPYTLLRDGLPLLRGTAALQAGRAIVRCTDRLQAPGGHRYQLRISPENDPHPGNNTAERWLEITGGPRVLLVSAYSADPLAISLRGQGLTVEHVTDLPSLHAGQLQGARAVVLNNVPANRLPAGFLAALDFFVRAQGGGLLMAGGKASFACGGYFGSPIAGLLPVSMELREDQRKLSTALVIPIDRSGSMSMALPDGRTKIELAAAGAARAVELLGPGDQISVVAVDTQPHEIVPLCVVGNSAPRLANLVRRITSEGGGINVYTALMDAWSRLRQSPSGQRHVILFADANDALQEVGRYKEALEKMREDKITVSVIALGAATDSGGEFLTDVAKRGEGRIFFASDANALPSLFEQETVAVARAAFIEEPAPLKPLSGWAELAANPLPWPAGVDGFNLCYLQPGATAAAITADEEAAPLVAFWQRGAGRAAAVMFPLGGDFSAQIRGWKNYGDFAQTVLRWLMGEARPPGCAVRAEVEGTTLTAELFFDATWEKALAQNAPKCLLAGTAGQATPLVWERMEPGRYRATAALEPGQMVRGVVQLLGSPENAKGTGTAGTGTTGTGTAETAGNNSPPAPPVVTLPFGPLQAGSGAEWAFDPAQPARLAAISRASGGAERLDLTAIWNAPRPPEFSDIRFALLPALLALFLLETLLTRLQWSWAAWRAQPSKPAHVSRHSWFQKISGVTTTLQAIPRKLLSMRLRGGSAPGKHAAMPGSSVDAAAPQDAAPSRRDRFQRAKRGR